jgi:hypothetical protein
MTIVNIESYSGKFRLNRVATPGTIYRFIGKEKVPFTQTGMLQVKIDLATIRRVGGRTKYIRSTSRLQVTLFIKTNEGTFTYTMQNGERLKFPMSNLSFEDYSIDVSVDNSSAPNIKGIIMKTIFAVKTESELINSAPIITKTISFNGDNNLDIGLSLITETSNKLNYVVHRVEVNNDQDNGFIKFYDRKNPFQNSTEYSSIEPKFSYSVSILNNNNTVTYNPPHIFQNGILIRAVNGTQQYYSNMYGSNSGINDSDGGVMMCTVSITYAILT